MLRIFIAMVVLSVVGLIWLRRREGKYLKKRTREALSDSLRSEIEEERRLSEEKRHKFLEAMKQASH